MTTEQRKSNLMPNNIPKYIRVYDNLGDSFDRYTVIFTRADKIGYKGRVPMRVMSEYPYSPTGVGLWMDYDTHVIQECKNGWPPAIGRKNHLGLRIKFEALPEDCQKCVIADYMEVWQLQ